MDLRFEDRATPGRSRKAGGAGNTTKGMPTLLAKFTLFVVEVGAEGRSAISPWSADSDSRLASC
jgi:hypothetical protein